MATKAQLQAQLDALNAQLAKVQAEVSHPQPAYPVVDDPEGVFKGMTMAPTDSWQITRTPPGMTVIALPGGSHVDVHWDKVKAPPGTYTFGYSVNGGVEKTKAFTVI